MTSNSSLEALLTPPYSQSLWIFGYGSLVWRPAFSYSSLCVPLPSSHALSAAKSPNAIYSAIGRRLRKYGYIKGYKRRFWQGSTDHRGVPEAPGRVVTLISKTESDFHHPLDLDNANSDLPAQHDVVWGVCYEVPPEKIAETLEYLDVRERGGYERNSLSVYSEPTHDEPILKNVLLYTATTTNHNYLGPAPLSEIAKTIAVSVGPSGANIEYLFNLHQTLRANGIHDQHVADLYQLVSEIVQKKAAVAS